ncbi:MAG TPA: AraC family transcriptional regulator [Gaiellaceae bacterium]|nr:AraC family transcriptional regulator [Gaiellaceae bacterium]
MPHSCEILRERVLDVTRRLVSERGPSVTLADVAHNARTAGAAPQDDAIVGSLLEQPLGDLVEVVQVADAQHRLATSAPDAEWTQSVREILSAELGRPALSLREAARTLAVSPRTLQRRLADEGTSWRAEIDAARKERAAQLLARGATTDLAAVRVGYSGSRALRRALHRWGNDDFRSPVRS